ncbi:unnamed protein product [Brassica oleracea]
MFERKKSPNRLVMHVYDEFECSGMLTRISHALKFSVHLMLYIRRQEETKVAHLLLIVSFDDMQRALPTFSSIALDRMLEPGARRFHHLYRLKLKLFPDESTETKPCAETQRHLELLGKIILIIVRAESTSEIWGLYARWSRIKGDLMVCSEAMFMIVKLETLVLMGKLVTLIHNNKL